MSSYDKSKMAVNADGSVDVYVGPAKPNGLTSNSIPTAGRDFWLMERFYGPEQRLVAKKWTMPTSRK